MRENYKPFTAVSCQTTLVNKTGTWRTQRPVYQERISPCRFACPARNDIPEWLALVEKGELQKAWELIVETNPLPFVCGSVCPHPCEAHCNRGQFDQALSIRDLERYLGEEALRNHWRLPRAAGLKEAKIAIIGSGPAGLTCAYDLVKLGYAVTIFEALPVAGGMLAVGIPNYRLPKEMLKIEVEAIQKLGVEIKLNTPIGKDVTFDALWAQGHKAIFIAVGAHKSRKLNIPGEDSEGVVHGTDFLRELDLGKEVKVKEKVATVGGGNVAIDAARSAIRLGAREVFILYRRSREEMPALDEEIEAAQAEGVNIQYLVAPVEILSQNGKVTGIKCIRMELGEPDETGRKRPIPIEGSEFTIDAEMVIPAIGQAPDLSFVSDGKFRIGRGDTFEVDPISLETNVPGVFAGGDAVIGPATVIEAIAAGRRAAWSIDRYLRGESLTAEEEANRIVEFQELNLDYFEHQARQARIFDHSSAVEEARRCFSCGYCNLCGNCYIFCPDVAVRREEDHYQIDYDYCKGCGICAQECPTRSIVLVKE